MFKKNLNEPLVCTPSRICRLTLAPGASGEPKVTVVVVALLLKPPPKGWAGGVSSCVPKMVIVHGDDGEPGDAAHVTGSLTVSVVLPEVSSLRSATPPLAIKVVLISTTRIRKRVTGAPVLFWKRRLIDIVPVATFGPIAVVSRTRFGLPAAPLVESSRNATTSIVYRGLPRPC